MESSTSLFGQVYFQIKGSLVVFLEIPYLIEIPVLNANSADPDQMLLSAVSYLGLHCLSMSLLWDSRLKWIKYTKPK